MIFEVKYSNQARKFLKKAEKHLLARIIAKIERLCVEPIMADTKKIQAYQGLFRVRVGDYRILYEVDNAHKLIGIVAIDKREDIY
jgi:mRNA interferase RelE/StbE